jgi:hypothetical protein
MMSLVLLCDEADMSQPTAQGEERPDPEAARLSVLRRDGAVQTPPDATLVLGVAPGRFNSAR